jgi:hypothetical protein
MREARTPPACERCGGASRWHRSTHSHGWGVRAWCYPCERDAVIKHVWYSKLTFIADELTTMTELHGSRAPDDGRQRVLF